MDFYEWAATNGLAVLNAVGVVGGLFFSGHAALREVRARKISNLIELTQNHRELWSHLFQKPGLSRVLDPAPNLTSVPVTPEEMVFVTMLVVHLNTYYQAIKSRQIIAPRELPKDIQWLFSLPIFAAVWTKMRVVQDREFVIFIEKSFGPTVSI